MVIWVGTMAARVRQVGTYRVCFGPSSHTYVCVAFRLSNMRTTPPSPDTSERGINREYPSHYRPLPDQERLIKQTYSVIVRHPFDARPARKWHLSTSTLPIEICWPRADRPSSCSLTVAYFTQGSIDNLRTIDDVPPLANLEVPSGVYRSARTQKRPAPSSNALGSRSRAVDPPPHIPQSIAPWPPRIAGPSLTSFTPRAPRPHSYSNPVGRVGSFSPCPPHLDGAPRSSVSDQGFIFSPTSPSSQGCFPELPFAPDTNNGEAQGSYHYLPPLGPQLDIFVANSRGRTRNPEDERQLEAISKRLF